MRVFSLLLPLFLIVSFTACDDDCSGDLQPLANFNVENNNCSAECTVGFSSTTIGEVDFYQWDFGDGGSATGNPVSKTYFNRGTYTVTLTVQNDCGWADSIQKEINIEN